jgi:hypothetical protein
VIVAGAGLATPLGLGCEATFAGWTAGRDGLAPNDRWPTAGYPRDDAGLVPDFRPRKVLPDRKAVKLMGREVQLGVYAAVEACGGVDVIERLGLDAGRVGAFAAAGYEVSSLADHEAMLAASRDPDDLTRLSLQRLFESGRDLYNPMAPLRVLPNMGLFHAGLAIGARGPHLSLGSSAAAGLAALAEACESLAAGDCDAALVLGTDAQTEEFRAQLLVEARVVPALAPAEGAAALLLTPEGDGPRVLAWRTGQEPTATGFGDPLDDGETRSVIYQRVLEQAGEVDLVLADLWDRPDHDEAELAALPDVPRLASRPRMGWMGAAHGLADVALACGLVQTGAARRVLVTASGLAGDVAAVVVGGAP